MAKTKVHGEFLKDSVVRFTAKAGENITKGQAVYISGVSGEKPVVSLADADDTAKMPAFGLAEATVSTNAEVEITSFGTLGGLDTSSYSLGDILYVDTTAGSLTNNPSGLEATKLQNIGMVQRVHATNGSIKVGGAGRTNAVPNLDDGDIFIGDSNNKAVSDSFTNVLNTEAGINSSADATAITIDSSENVGIGTGSPSAKLNVSSGSVKIVNSGTDAYFLEGVRDGGNVTLRMYDNSNNLYIDSYTNMSFRANQTGSGSGGHFYLSGGNVGINVTSAPADTLDVNGNVRLGSTGRWTTGTNVFKALNTGEKGASIRSAVSSASAPTYSNVDDTGTGIYFPATYQIGITSNSLEKVRVHNNSTMFTNRIGLKHPSELMFNGEYNTGGQDIAVEAGHAARIEFLKDDFLRFQGSASVAAGAGVSYADKLKINIDSGGILFGSDTAAANTLDDYEEGSWTPQLSNGTSMGSNSATYTKIGNLVTVRFDITNGSGGGTDRIYGLPFDTVGHGSFHITWNNIGNANYIGGYSNSGDIQLIQSGTTSSWTLPNGNRILGFGIYYTSL